MSVHILILLFTSLFLKSADYLICIKIWFQVLLCSFDVKVVIPGNK